MLLYCTRNNIMQLEVVSSTDKKCLWKEKKVPVVDQYQAMPLLDTNCFQQLKIKAKKPCSDLSDLNYEAVLSTFLEACPNSALHKLGRSNPEHTKAVETVDSCCFDVTLTELAATTEIIRNIFFQENLELEWNIFLGITNTIEEAIKTVKYVTVVNNEYQLKKTSVLSTNTVRHGNIKFGINRFYYLLQCRWNICANKCARRSPISKRLIIYIKIQIF